MRGLRKKNLEFIRAARRNTAGGGWGIRPSAALILPGILLLSIGGRSLWQWNQIRQMEREADEIEAFISREDISLAVSGVTVLNRDMEMAESFLANVENAERILDSYPKIDKETTELLTESEAVFIEEVRLENGVLKFTAAAADYREAAPYIEKLEESGRFENIVYEGFKLTDMYRFRISCIPVTPADQQGRRENRGYP